jgi:hypothetical protein
MVEGHTTTTEICNILSREIKKILNIFRVLYVTTVSLRAVRLIFALHFWQFEGPGRPAFGTYETDKIAKRRMVLWWGEAPERLSDMREGINVSGWT